VPASAAPIGFDPVRQGRPTRRGFADRPVGEGVADIRVWGPIFHQTHERTLDRLAGRAFLPDKIQKLVFRN
jgi:hypothetical protein